MKILILGIDGYLGWPTALHFSRAGHQVTGVDNLSKRLWEAEVGVAPLWPILPLQSRVRAWERIGGYKIDLRIGDLTNHRFVYDLLAEDFDAIVHYAEQPSAPYSMMGRERAAYTQSNNVIGTLNLLFAIKKFCPQAHLVKLGTMGEYGTPNIDIEEGWLDLQHNGRSDRVLFPKKPGSFYHLSKVHDSHNIEFACRIWKTRATDLNQGVVYGTQTDETHLHEDLRTSFHYDDVFGTVINRFLVQSVVGHPLTVYGKGGQTRGFLDIRDTIQCVDLAVRNPAAPGEFRVFNQFTEQFSVEQLAGMTALAAGRLGLSSEVRNIPNPRIEAEQHYYNAKHTALPALGLQPHLLSIERLAEMLNAVRAGANRIDPSIIKPRVQWDSPSNSPSAAAE